MNLLSVLYVLCEFTFRGMGGKKGKKKKKTRNKILRRNKRK